MATHEENMKEESRAYVAMAEEARKRGDSQEAARLLELAGNSRKLAEDAGKDAQLFEATKP